MINKGIFLASAVALLTGFGSVPANAANGLLPLPAAVSGLMLAGQDCNRGLQPSFGAARSDVAAPALTKSAAILGGQKSKLEMMATQQGAALAPAFQTPSLQLAPSAAPQAGIGSSLAGNAAACPAFARAAVASRNFAPGLRPNPLGADDFMASRRLAVSNTAFDQSWDRVRFGRVPTTVTHPLQGLSGRDLLAAVNAWANHHIRYVEDRDQYGRSDFWAPAANTVVTGAGDCEDIAIVKMQMLAAMGVDRADLFLTVARDRVRNQDHALLIVKAGGKFWMLDNATDTLLDASQNHDYLPIMTFSGDNKWLHGF